MPTREEATQRHLDFVFLADQSAADVVDGIAHEGVYDRGGQGGWVVEDHGGVCGWIIRFNHAYIPSQTGHTSSCPVHGFYDNAHYPENIYHKKIVHVIGYSVEELVLELSDAVSSPRLDANMRALGMGVNPYVRWI